MGSLAEFYLAVTGLCCAVIMDPGLSGGALGLTGDLQVCADDCQGVLAFDVAIWVVPRVCFNCSAGTFLMGPGPAA
jgi:hypothetical protein